MSGTSYTLTEDEARGLVADFVVRVRAAAPDWTDANDVDPGIGLIALFAFLADTLAYRGTGTSDSASRQLRAALSRLGRRAMDEGSVFVTVDGRPWIQVDDLLNQTPSDGVFTAAVGSDGSVMVQFGDGVHGRTPSDGALVAATYGRGGGQAGLTVVARWPFDPALALRVTSSVGALRIAPDQAAVAETGAIRRVRYFPGQVLSADDFQTEQTYLRDKRRRHNRSLHGYGIVEGLEVTVTSTGLRISAGIALDLWGNDIVVDTPQELALPAGGREIDVSLCYAEREVQPVTVSGDDGVQCSRIEESFDVVVAEAPGEGGVALARLVKEEEVWSVDASFSPPRAR